MLSDANKESLRDHWRRGLKDPVLADCIFPDVMGDPSSDHPHDLKVTARPLRDILQELLDKPEAAEKEFKRIEGLLTADADLPHVEPQYHAHAYKNVADYIRGTEEFYARIGQYDYV